jgi:hypothetical protein
MTGPKDLEQMRHALKALTLGPLAPEALARIRPIGDYIHDHHQRLFS